MGLYARVAGAPEVSQRMGNSSARAAILRSHLEGELALLHGVVVIGTPVGTTSILRGAWATEVQTAAGRFIGIIGNPTLYADVMERGRRAGAKMPPPEAIATWVERKLGPDVDPYVVARAIARKGIKGRRMLQKAALATLPAREALRRATMQRLLEV